VLAPLLPYDLLLLVDLLVHLPQQQQTHSLMLLLQLLEHCYCYCLWRVLLQVRPCHSFGRLFWTYFMKGLID
jgi:hypothetical protein